MKTTVMQTTHREVVVGPDLREVHEWGLGSVVNCTVLRAAMGIKGKLPLDSRGMMVVGDTTIQLLSRAHAKDMFPKTQRPHRMIARCNHCLKWIPAGRFGQHLKPHYSTRLFVTSQQT